jgi:hypothetical protein
LLFKFISYRYNQEGQQHQDYYSVGLYKLIHLTTIA